MDTTDSFHNMMLHLSVDAFLLPAGEQSKVVKGISQSKCAVQRNSITRFCYDAIFSIQIPAPKNSNLKDPTEHPESGDLVYYSPVFI